jgi:hypothetical protein
MANPTFTERFNKALKRLEHNRPCRSTIARAQFEWYSTWVRGLTVEDPQLAGLLTARFHLARRLAAARKMGQARPELTARLRQVNAEIKGLAR